MKKNIKTKIKKTGVRIGVLFLILAVSASFIACGGFTTLDGVVVLSREQAAQQIRAYAKRIKYDDPYKQEGSLKPDTSRSYSEPTALVLPDIDTQTIAVSGERGKGYTNITIFTATERCVAPGDTGKSKDDLVNIAGTAFNDKRLQLSGGSIASVTVYAIPSGLGAEYISSGTFVPDAVNFSTGSWLKMLNSSGIQTTIYAQRTAGNTVGVVMSPAVEQRFIEKYKEVTMWNVISAVQNGDLEIGTTDMFRSSTMVTSGEEILWTLDPDDPLSDKAVRGFEQFLKNATSPVVTTAQLRNLLNLGILEAAFMEYQSFAQSPKLAGWSFYPFGRHDGPIAAVGELSAEKREALQLYTDYLLSDEVQNWADERYFNEPEYDYVEERQIRMSGDQILQMQNAWKTGKDAINPSLIYVIVDRSGSMEDYQRLLILQAAVSDSLYLINENNFIGMASFDDKVQLDLEICQATPRNKALMAQAMINLEPRSATATHDALIVAYDKILDFIEQDGRADMKVTIILISDGEQNEGLSLEDTLPSAYGIGFPIHAVGYKIDSQGETKLRKLVGALEKEGYEGRGSYTGADIEAIKQKLSDLFRSQG